MNVITCMVVLVCNIAYTTLLENGYQQSSVREVTPLLCYSQSNVKLGRKNYNNFKYFLLEA